MNLSGLLRVLLVPVLLAGTLALAAPREAEWKKIAEATEQRQPQTALSLLKPIEDAAFADQAWAEGTKALAMRIAINGELKGGLRISLKQLATEIPAAPPEARPLLRLLQARWLFSYYRDQRWNLANRSATTAPPGDDLETWDATRMLTEIDRRFQDSLADQAALRKIPVAEFGELLEAGDLGDELRPTLYDFLAHAALVFYSAETITAPGSWDAFEIEPASPAFDPADAFLAWHPDPTDQTSPKFRVLRLYQDLLTFHRADRDPTAFLHCDLERIRWAGAVASGAKKAERLDAALRAFVETNASHPVSADARLDLASALVEKNRTREAHALAKAGADAFPTHPFGKLCHNIVNQLEEKNIWVLSATHWTRSGEEITVNHANVSHLWFRAYRQKWQLDKSTLEQDPTPADRDADEDQALVALLRTAPAKSWDAPLRDDHDFAPRVTALPAPVDLPPGYYLIVASGNAGFSLENNRRAVMGVHVTSHALVVREESHKLAGLVTDAITGAPRAGIEVRYQFAREDDRGLATGATTTGADGWFSFPPFKEDPEHLAVVAGTGDDIAIDRPGYFSAVPFNEDLGKPSDEIVFFTDRAIYRPGQTISFKGIWCHSDWDQGAYRIRASQKTSVVLRDPRDKVLQQVEVVTNEYGSFSGTFTAPSRSMNGYCSIAAGTRGRIGFSVEEYKRPKFTAAIDAPAAPVTLGERVSLSGRATAFTGAPINGAAVKWRVTRSTRWPEWLRWSGFTPDGIGRREIAAGSTITAADGTFSITFPAVPDAAIDPTTDPEFTYRIVADITEPSGETCQAGTSVRAAATTLKASVFADAWLVANQPLALHIRTTSHDGDGRPAEGVLRIFKLIEPAVCSRGGASEKVYENCAAEAFPPGNSSNPARWATGEKVAELPVKTSPDDHGDIYQGETDVTTLLPAGAYRAVFVARDANGREVQAICNLQVVDPTSDTFPTKIPFFTAYNTDEIEPGHAFTLVWGSGHPVARACVEWFKSGALIKREWSAPGRTQQVFSLTPDDSMRGGFTVCVTQTTLNSHQHFMATIEVPWTNKDLKLRWEHLTSKLQPGAKDTWTAVVTGPDGAAAAAEVAATMYDASLEAFSSHHGPELGHLFRGEDWPFYEHENDEEIGDFYSYGDWDSADRLRLEHPYRNIQYRDVLRTYDESRHRPEPRLRFMAWSPHEPQYYTPPEVVDPFCERNDRNSATADAALNQPNRVPKPDASQVAARKNLRETAFFYPHLTSNDKGEVRITFTMPEALTKWKFLGFAHDKDMRSGTLEGETVTAKDLMVQPNPPRFLREGDALDFTVKITNQSDTAQAGTARLTLADAATENDATAALGITGPDQPWTIPAKESRTLSWRLTVPDGTGFLTYKAQATSGTLSDGEEGWLPVIPHRVLLTESMALPIRDAGTKDYRFQKLLDSGKSTTLENRFVHLQVVSQPAWYAVMALPYLMEFPHECAEQTFNRYYANALARHLATANPKIRRIFDLWKNTPTLESPLARNADLTGILLEETPWLNEATEQSQARRQLGLLFDDNRLGEQLKLTMKKLTDMQDRDGRWPWFPGGQGNEYISLYITTGFARLRALGVATDIAPALKALPRLDASLTERHAAIQQAAAKDPEILATNHLDCRVAHHLYTRTFFLKDSALKRGDQAAFEYFTAQAKKFWPTLGSRMSRAHAALALFRLGDETTARLITRSLRETAVTNEETGMSWRDAEGDSARSTTTSTPSKPVRFGSSNKSKFVIGTAPKPPPTPSTPCSWAAGIC
ncbi:MAG: MG2 domain-containing protein [Verrucomicrobia bacterium]|nr:MG2 domain-containing protein [Verrucomicrobiota bacterium]